MKNDLFILGLLIWGIVGLTLHWRGESGVQAPKEWSQILHDLRHECDPANPDADYSMVQSSLPTEMRREAILQKCRELGPSLLPVVRSAIGSEKDAELRGMLKVIAATLGDAEHVIGAAEEMLWSDYPALKISAAKILRRLNDKRTIYHFRCALQDDYYVVNGACGLLRERFYPVRAIAQQALIQMNQEPMTEQEMIQRRRAEIIRQAEEAEREIARRAAK
ncbi:MAG: hypothetical protein IPK32_22445 [Verrucomicrobiaceae bacterium]|nr:hypothetical protein [Verrucomicrobiaceae bacterium]